jgi:hypothetical protein
MNRTTPAVHNQPAQLTNYNLFSSHSAHEPLVMLDAQPQI